MSFPSQSGELGSDVITVPAEHARFLETEEADALGRRVVSEKVEHRPRGIGVDRYEGYTVLE